MTPIRVSCVYISNDYESWWRAWMAVQALIGVCDKVRVEGEL